MTDDDLTSAPEAGEEPAAETKAADRNAAETKTAPENQPPEKQPFWSAGAVRTILVSVVAVVVGGAILGLALTGPDPSSEAPSAPDVASPTAIDEETRDDDVVVFATQVLETWARSDLDYRSWWAELKPMLSPGGRQAYAYTEPSKIPELEDIKPSEISRGGDGTTATVFFSTSAGRFGVDVSRQGPKEPWRAHRVIFPDQGSVFG